VNPQDLDALMVAAYSSAALGDRDAALQYLDRALRHAPEDAEVNFYAARVYARLGDMSAARQWAQKAVAHGYSRADVGSGPDLAQIGAEIAKTAPTR
jgi:tetratricopeptide (TPR) repeat protein